MNERAPARCYSVLGSSAAFGVAGDGCSGFGFGSVAAGLVSAAGGLFELVDRRRGLAAFFAGALAGVSSAVFVTSEPSGLAAGVALAFAGGRRRAGLRAVLGFGLPAVWSSVASDGAGSGSDFGAVLAADGRRRLGFGVAVAVLDGVGFGSDSVVALAGMSRLSLGVGSADGAAAVLSDVAGFSATVLAGAGAGAGTSALLSLLAFGGDFGAGVAVAAGVSAAVFWSDLVLAWSGTLGAGAAASLFDADLVSGSGLAGVSASPAVFAEVSAAVLIGADSLGFPATG